MRLENDKISLFVKDLRSACDSVVDKLGVTKNVNQETILEMALLQPAKSFYVSRDECVRAINRIKKTGQSGKKKENEKKFNDIYMLFNLLISKGYTKKQAIDFIVDDCPAPKFYITVSGAMKYLYKYKNL